MMRNVRVVGRTLLTVVAVTLAGCADTSPDSADGTAGADGAGTYIETGDLDAIRARGKLRVGNVAKAELDELPRLRYGAPGEGELSREFADRLGVEFEIEQMVDESEAIEALVAGRVDLIIGRKGAGQAPPPEGVAYSLAFRSSPGVLISLAGRAPHEEGDLEGRTVTLSERSPFLFAGEALVNANAGVTVDTLSASVPPGEVLRMMLSGEVDVGLGERWVAEALLEQYPEFEIGMEFGGEIQYTAAVREGSDELLRVVNAFAFQILPSSGRSVRVFRDLDSIQTGGILRVLTVNGPSTYFVHRGSLVGFDYELMAKFADEQDLVVQMVVVPTVADLTEWLRRGLGDVVGAGILPEEGAEAEDIAFTRLMNATHPVVIARSDAGIEPGDDLTGRTVLVRRNSPYLKVLQLKSDSAGYVVRVTADAESTRQVLDRIEEGDADLTVIESHLAEPELDGREMLTVVQRVEDAPGQVWAARVDQPILVDSLNTFLSREYRGLFYNILVRKYFRADSRILVQPDVGPDGKLSPWDELSRSQIGDMDWRLFTAQMYVESHFDPTARSSMGAYGLMQMMPRTAEQMGVSDLDDPEEQIRAGAEYLRWIDARFSAKLEVIDRYAFTLASYNAGYGHVQDARRVAERMGLDPDLWFGNVEVAMLTLSDPDVYTTVPHGYVRGAEPVKYVRRITELGEMYVRLAPNSN